MSISCDLVLDDIYHVHVSVIPKLGLLVVNELDDFAENWIEVKVVENSKYKLQYDILTLAGNQGDGALHAASRYFVDVLHNNIHKKAGPTPEQIGSLLKFILNINLRPEILNNRTNITSLGNALEKLLNSHHHHHHRHTND